MKAHHRRLAPLSAINGVFLFIACSWAIYALGPFTRDVQKAQMRVMPRTGISFSVEDIKSDERIDYTYFFTRYHHASKAMTIMVGKNQEYTATILDREATYDPPSQCVISREEIDTRRVPMVLDEVAGMKAFLDLLRSSQKGIESWDEEFVVLEFFRGGVRVGAEHLFVPSWAQYWGSSYDLAPLYLRATITEDQWRQIGAFRGMVVRSTDEDDSNSERSGSL